MKRRTLLNGLGAVALLLAANGAEAQAPVPASAPVPSPTVTLAFVGDVMLAERPGQLIRRGGDPFKYVAPRLAQADVRIGNLECVIATTGTPDDKPYTFRAHPRTLPLLKKHLDAVSLANNHSGDFGHVAFAEMLQRLERAGLPYFGGGRNLAAAHRPLVIERKGLRIALLGYDEFFPRHFEAGEGHPGVAWSEDAHVVADIRAAREQHRADLVIPFMHWGEEHRPLANDRQRELARLMIDAGADAVVGTHPHVVQDVETYRGRPIVYSLGNFVFDGFSDADNNTGWMLFLEADARGVKRWRIETVHMDRDGTPRPAPGSNTSPWVSQPAE